MRGEDERLDDAPALTGKVHDLSDEDERTTLRGLSPEPAFGPLVECCICLEDFDPGSLQRGLDEVGFRREDVSEHSAAGGSCLGRVFETTCAACVATCVASWERDPSKLGSAPCPLCRLPLREISAENRGYRAWLSLQSTCDKFRRDCEELRAILLDANALPLRADARAWLVALDRREKDRRRLFSEHINEDVKNDCPFSKLCWYADAIECLMEDASAYKRAKEQYRRVWPSRASRAERAAEAGTELWQGYDQAAWDAATDRA